MTNKELKFLRALIERSDQNEGITFIDNSRTSLTIQDYFGGDNTSNLKKGVYVNTAHADTVNIFEHYRSNEDYDTDCGMVHYFDFDNLREV
jgi:hypothetical protein